MHAAAVVLLVLAVAVTAACTVGLLRAGDPLARMHYLSPVSTLATAAVAVAVALDGASAAMAVKVAIVFVLTALTSPVTQHKVARALWVRRHGGWKLPGKAAE